MRLNDKAKIGAMRHALAPSILAISIATVGFAATSGDPEKDPQMKQLLQDAGHLIEHKKADAAIPMCDAVIGAYSVYYNGGKQKVYCARSSTQSLGSLLQAAADKNNAITLSSTWADAYFLKSYALQELHRVNEAKGELGLALKLSPFESHYMNELAEIYGLEKNWAKAKELYQRAEDAANLAPDAIRANELARARRGLGYVLVELGKLDEAEKKYQECLVADPNDGKAKAELAYVREQKAKRAGR